MPDVPERWALLAGGHRHGAGCPGCLREARDTLAPVLADLRRQVAAQRDTTEARRSRATHTYGDKQAADYWEARRGGLDWVLDLLDTGGRDE